MPGLSGLEVLEELQKLDPNVKVLMASGFIVDANLERARAPLIFIVQSKTFGF